MLRSIRLILVCALGLSAQTARYPNAIATNTDLTDLADRAQTTLNGSAMNASQTFATVVSSSKFTTNMIITIDNEQMKICSISPANQLNFGNASCPNVDGRGWAGTTATSHQTAVLVSDYFTAYQFKALREEIKAIESTLGTNLSNAGVSYFADAKNMAFTPLTPGGALANGNNTVTLSLVPPGVNGSDANHWLWVSGGTGTAEPCKVNGGTGVASQVNGQIILACTGSHTNAWTVQSATGGIQEAMQAASTAGGGTALARVGTYPLYAAPRVLSNVTLWLMPGATMQVVANQWPATPTAPWTGSSGGANTPIGLLSGYLAVNCTIRGGIFDANGANQGNATYGQDIGLDAATNCLVEGTEVINSYHDGAMFAALDSVSPLGSGNRFLNVTGHGPSRTVGNCPGGVFSQSPNTTVDNPVLDGMCDEGIVANGFSLHGGKITGNVNAVVNGAHAENSSNTSFEGLHCYGRVGNCVLFAPSDSGGSNMHTLSAVDIKAFTDGTYSPTTLVGITDDMNGHIVSDWSVIGGSIDRGSSRGVLVYPNASGGVTNGLVSGVVIRNTASNGLEIRAPATKINVANNTVTGSISGSDILMCAPATNCPGSVVSFNHTTDAFDNLLVTAQQPLFQATHATAPAFAWVTTAAPANQKNWYFAINGGDPTQLTLLSANDAGSSTSPFLTFNRSGASYTASSINVFTPLSVSTLANSADQGLYSFAPNGSFIKKLPSASAGLYNPLVQNLDQLVTDAAGSGAINTGGFCFPCPYSTSSFGARWDNVAKSLNVYAVTHTFNTTANSSDDNLSAKAPNGAYIRFLPHTAGALQALSSAGVAGAIDTGVLSLSPFSTTAFTLNMDNVTKRINATGLMRMTPVLFGALPACAAGSEGAYASVTDASAATWGTTITGSSTNHVLVYCDGTNWSVAGK
jgi:hypothetical protein